MKRYLLIGLLLLSAGLTALAIPASRRPFRYTQPDGTSVLLQRHGDEFFHYLTDPSGKIVERGADGYLRPVSRGQVSLRKAAAVRRRSQAARFRSRRLAPASGNFGERHFLVILVEFSDISFTVSNPQSAFSSQMNQVGYSTSGATGSVRDYFSDNSGNRFTPVFDVYGPVKVSKSYSYYGTDDNGVEGNDHAPEEAFNEACKLVSQQYSVNFSDYDSDGDGEMDAVFFYFAGYNQAEVYGSYIKDGEIYENKVSGAVDGDATIWPHEWEMSQTAIPESSRTYGGVVLNTYSCTSELYYTGEMCGIGTACHEFGHAIGLPDLYDTNYGDEDEYGSGAAGLYIFSVMCGGGDINQGRTPPYMNCLERYLLGWMDFPTEITKSGAVTIPAVQNNAGFYTKTNTDGEYFIYECRSGVKWDAFLPQGMLVYHYDHSSRNVTVIIGEQQRTIPAGELWEDWRSTNAINSCDTHPCFYVVSSTDPTTLSYPFDTDSYPETSNEAWYSAYYNDHANLIFPGKNNVTSFDLTDWSDKKTPYSVSGISYSGGQVTMTVKAPVVEGILTGKVSDAQGAGISGATVLVKHVSSGTEFPGTTDFTGVYSVNVGESKGLFSVAVSAEGYFEQSANVAISANTVVKNFTLEAVPPKYPDLGFNYIAFEKSVYQSGDELVFELSLTKGSKPSSVTWVFDGVAKNAASVTLTSGRHTLSARLAFSSGATQVLEAVILVP